MEILKPYRRRIDELDDRIIDLLAQRIEVIREVGALKFRENIPSVIPERVEEVRERAAARAQGHGIDPEFIRRLYTLLIGYSCDLEEDIRAELSRARKAGGA